MLTFKPVNAVVETESAETGDRGIACSESVQLWWADRNNRGQAGQPGAPETKELHRLRWGGGWQFLHMQGAGGAASNTEEEP